MENNNNRAKQIVDRFGGQSSLAGMLGKRQSTVQHWVRIGRIPAQWHKPLLELAYEKGIGKGPINIGSGLGYTIREVVKIITNATNCSSAIRWDTSKPSGEPRKVLDISKAKLVLGFKPAVSFEKAVERTVAWYRQYGKIVSI